MPIISYRSHSLLLLTCSILHEIRIGFCAYCTQTCAYFLNVFKKNTHPGKERERDIRKGARILDFSRFQGEKASPLLRQIFRNYSPMYVINMVNREFLTTLLKILENRSTENSSKCRTAFHFFLIRNPVVNMDIVHDKIRRKQLRVAGDQTCPVFVWKCFVAADFHRKDHILRHAGCTL